MSSAIVFTAPFVPARDAKVPAPRQHRPIENRTVHADGTADSTNWSGYALTSANVTQVTGSWIVPPSSCSKDATQYASFWVGIDGWTSPTVEQIGTDSDCIKGKPSYYAWYEFYPEPYYLATGLTDLTPGDVMSASVTYNADRTFTATISDTNTHVTYSTTLVPNTMTGTPARSSAEWITEASSGTERIYPLADFGVVKFGPDFTVISNTSTATVGSGIPGVIGSFPAVDVWSTTMVTYAKKPVPMATPSPLTQDGSSFYVTWNSAGP